ncbi:MAG: helix-turn-helix domain-containing protein [Pseudomonadota bacterium]
MIPQWTKSISRPVKINLLLFNRFSNLCLANCIEPLRAANTLLARQVFQWSILTPDGCPSRSSSGLDILAHHAAGQMKPSDYLFVLASYDHERHDTSDTRHLLQSVARRSGVIVGLDAGPWLIAAAGLLENRHATVHWDLLPAFSEAFLNVQTERRRIVRDGSLVTCAGAMSALDLTLELIAEHAGEATRLDVSRLFFHGEPPLPEMREERTPDLLVRKAIDIMSDRLERPLSLTDLAKRLSCQPRTLDRRFRARLGAPPGQVYRHMRLSAARSMIEESRRSITEIALLCGYESPAALTRAIRRQYGVSPRALRMGALSPRTG